MQGGRTLGAVSAIVRPRLGWALSLAIAGITAGLFSTLKRLLVELPPDDPMRLYVLLGVALAGSWAGAGQATRSFNILLRATVGVLMVYVLTAHMSGLMYPLNGAPFVEGIYRYGPWVALGAGLVTVIRPSFGILPIGYVIWEKVTLSEVTGIRITFTDWVVLADIGIFLVLGFIIVALLRKFRVESRISRLLNGASTQPGTADHHDVLVVVCVAFHFGNYFYSGLEKTLIGEHVFQWLVENRTDYLILAALTSGNLPIAASDWLTEVVYGLSAKFFYVINFLTLFGQLACIGAIWRTRWAIWCTLFYDLQHIMIFLLTGIFFWKWILLNFAIVIALSQIRKVSWPAWVSIAFMLIIICSPMAFQIVKLAWFDSGAMNHVHFEAVTADGDTYAVPSNYFLATSVTFAQQRIGDPGSEHFSTGTWGATYSPTIMHQANACALPVGEQSELLRDDERMSLDQIIRRHHAFVLANVDDQGRIDYDWFPHHIWSVPPVFEEFWLLDKREIASYRYVVESVCNNFVDGRLVSELKLRGAFDIPVTDISATR